MHLFNKCESLSYSLSLKWCVKPEYFFFGFINYKHEGLVFLALMELNQWS